MPSSLYAFYEENGNDWKAPVFATFLFLVRKVTLVKCKYDLVTVIMRGFMPLTQYSHRFESPVELGSVSAFFGVVL
jgi:hypothetical protein